LVGKAKNTHFSPFGKNKHRCWPLEPVLPFPPLWTFATDSVVAAPADVPKHKKDQRFHPEINQSIHTGRESRGTGPLAVTHYGCMLWVFALHIMPITMFAETSGISPNKTTFELPFDPPLTKIEAQKCEMLPLGSPSYTLYT
jgi:hypothetical protein